MPEIDPNDLFTRLGRIEATLNRVEEGQDELRRHVNHEVDLLQERMGKIEVKQDRDEVRESAHWKMLTAIGGAITFIVSIAALLLSGAWHDLFGRH